MKTVKKSFFRHFDKVILLLLGGFGLFSACNIGNNRSTIIDTPVEYGVPHADFELKGIVTNAATSQPIQNIRVVRSLLPESKPEGEDTPIPGDTVYTDKDGTYAFAFGGFPGFPDMNYQLKFEDIDGKENGGLFQTKEIEGKFTQDDLEEVGSGWYSGLFVKTEDVALKK